MPRQTEKLAVLFADICGSTSLYEKLGDNEARRLIAKCIAAMLDKVSTSRGTLVKTIGDEIMCTFPEAANAMSAACAMQEAVENGDHGNDPPMHIRIGFHYGDVIREDEDIFGDTVNVASRIASITRAGQILTSRAASDSLPPALREQATQIMRAELKGKQEQLDIFNIAWEADDTQRTRIGTPASRRTQENDSELTLRYREQSIKLDGQRQSALLGRDHACDLPVKNDFASRQHARVEFRNGKFVLTDQSTNGTYVRFADGQTVRLAREDLVLHSSGAISLGQPSFESPDNLVEFSTMTATA